MIQSLIANLTLFTTFLMLVGNLSRNMERRSISATYTRFMIGALNGLFGILLMYFNVEVSSGMFIDFRQLPIIAAAHFGGPYASITAGIVIALGRISLFQGTSSSYISAVCTLILAGIGMGLISRYVRGIRLRWTSFLLYQTFLTCFSLLLLMRHSSHRMLPAFVLLAAAGIVFMYFLINYIDTTDRLKAQLLESEKQYRRLIEHAPDAVCVHTDELVLYANDKALRLFGVPNQEELTQLIKHLYPDYHAKIADSMSAIRNHETATFNLVSPLKGPNGRSSSVEAAVSAIKYQRQPAMLATFRDASSRLEAEKKLLEANRILQELSSQDGLTHLYNRQFFELKLEMEWDGASRKGFSLSIILCDIDHFKAYNDTYGHQGGDRCLHAVAQTIKSALAVPSAFAARYGGEEFSVILPGTGPNDALAAAQAIRTAVEQLRIPHATSQVSDIVTVSVGVASVVPAPLSTAAQLVEAADLALYQAKREGRNRVVLHEASEKTIQ